MKILYSPASPYSAKVRMAAHIAGVQAEGVLTDTNTAPAVLVDSNPLGKIPTLLTEQGQPVYDSRAIMHFLDRSGSQRLYPRNAVKRTEVEVLEALCDGICDCLLAIIYERRFRPEEKLHQEWIDKQWTKVARGLDYLEANLPRMTKSPNGGQLALAALLGYLGLRFTGQWERGRPKLKRWNAKFAANFPEINAMRPSA
ncbi:glutathione S-transferase [Hoeflea sp. YIM 152468]|uniref:glutathione S-transferase n=1 Tax=Hoeflea sp. YIM 152468 TaxID=3031759 RepID=UPI0023DA66DC|nr:glutathione S-transferase [Hoeflea sp. YIM 152468]MDF1607200.1 glutathione S-transferase [Hoeflea sp. YIM 152468]